MKYSQAVRYVNNGLRFCNLLNEDSDSKQKYFLRKMLEEKEEKSLQEETMHKVCPCCFMQMPLTNECPICGYKR